MKFVTRKDFDAVSAGATYWVGRWPYVAEAARMAEKINPSTAIELGPNGLTIVKDCVTMGLTGPNSIQHDATKAPWPIPNKSYDLFVALQVWEHLGSQQGLAFSEVMRISKNAILSFPYMWSRPKDPVHHMITDDKIKEWTLGVKPEETIVACKRKIYRYKF